MTQITLVETLDMERLEALYWDISMVRDYSFISDEYEEKVKNDIAFFFYIKNLDKISLHNTKFVRRILKEIEDLFVKN